METSLPRYDPAQTYRWNYDHAPDKPPDLLVPAMSGSWSLCGRAVPSPLGIAAGPLLNGRWALYYAALGFDVLTYKTTRSGERDCYPLPNLQPVAAPPLARGGERVAACDAMREAWAISFGMPSAAPSTWRADVEWTRARLAKEKLLSVSVVASPQPKWSEDQLAADFAQCARWAVESGADLVELNFSCPNVASADGQLYQQPAAAGRVAARVKAEIGATPLLLKLGFVETEELTESLVEALSPHAAALVMTNCISAVVENERGAPLFDGQPRGIGGEPIRAASIAQVARFADCLRAAGSPAQVIGVGGIFKAGHVRDYLQAGAAGVQLATAVMLDPLVGVAIRRAWDDENRSERPM